MIWLASWLMLLLPTGAYAQGETPPKPTVWILATGGTIAGAADQASGSAYRAGVVPLEQVLGSVRGLDELAVIRAEQVIQIASQDMTPGIWLRLARRINALLAREEVAGVVVTHGTDTMEETACFLHLTIKSDKPVVLTGAMRPATALGADGPHNLYQAVACAVSPLARGRGVMTVMDGRILSADNLTKAGTLDTEVFENPEFGPLGRMYNDRPHFTRSPRGRHTLQSEFDVARLDSLPRVEVVGAYAGSTSLFIRAAVQAGSRGIVLAGVGNGNASAEMLNAAESARRSGVAIVRSTRIMRGPTTQWSEVDDEKLGFTAAWYANPYRARVLLMLALTRTADPRELQRIFTEY